MRLLKLLLILFICLFFIAVIGFIIAGWIGLLVGILLVLAYYLFLYLQASSILVDSALAKPASKEKFAELHATVRDICQTLGVASPKIALAPSPQPNAFVCGGGPQKYTLVLTRGLLEMENQEQAISLLTATLALTQFDLFLHTYLTAFASFFTKFAQLGQFSILSPSEKKEKGNSISALLFFILAPFAAFCIKFVAFKERHYLADFKAASIIRKPELLANALEEVSRQVENDIPLINPNPSLAHLYIVHPFSHKTLSSFFDIHPPLSTRLTKLNNMLI